MFKNSVLKLAIVCVFFFFVIQTRAGQIKAFQADIKSIAFYYHHIDSVRELLIYDRVVLTPGAITSRQLQQLKKAGVEVYAYLSVGEIQQKLLTTELKSHIITRNDNWDSYVMDMSAPTWQKYLTDKALTYKKFGFDGLFLDTLDSYQMATSVANTKQQQALVAVINQLSTIHSKLLLNRGFELVSQLDNKPSAVIAESLYWGYESKSGNYYKVKTKDSMWLSTKLNEIQALNIEIIVIDYLDGQDRIKQQAQAKQILKQGYTPYVSDGLLKQFGVSTVVPVARRILSFYDGQDTLKHQSKCHRLLSMLIEYRGYVPECLDLSTIDLSAIDTTRYQAIALWLTPEKYQTDLLAWISSNLGKTRIVFLGSLPDDENILSRLGVIKEGVLEGKLSLSKSKLTPMNELVLPNADLKRFPRYRALSADIETQVAFTDQTLNESIAIFTAPWGSAVIDPLLMRSSGEGKNDWLFDIYVLFDLLFNFPVLPVPDITTESGQRILTAHIDGDGFPSRSWMPGKAFSAQTLLDEILEKYLIPHTVSVIEGEISAQGLYPELSNELEAIAKDIFKLKHVELASHSFSHPFFWDDRGNVAEKKYGDSLPIPNYSVDYDREVMGSVDYINKVLAPENKKVKIFLWTGLANPTVKTIEKTEEIGLVNVNGGNTFVVNGDDSLTQVFPHLLWYEQAVQVYAPVINENLYTNLWTENFSGFQHAIETFELLGTPKRLKPISIYYHMYSGVYPSSLKALDNIYQWSMKQNTTPLYLSEYASRAKTLYETGIGKPLGSNNEWLVVSTGIKSIRIASSFNIPDLDKSNIAGWNDGPDGRYLTLTEPRTLLSFQDKKAEQPYLRSVNGIVEKWQKHNEVISFRIKSHVPLSMVIENSQSCEISKSNHTLEKTMSPDTGLATYTFSEPVTLTGELSCK